MDKYLMHHGIRGQKWGVMNGPPYPLNDNVKAIAYRGGVLKDGTQLDINKKDVATARKIINKNIKYLSTQELNEYKNRLMLESSLGDITGSNWAEKQGKKILDSLEKVATNVAVGTGSKFLTNASMLGISKILLNADVPVDTVEYLTKYKENSKKDNDDDFWFTDESIKGWDMEDQMADILGTDWKNDFKF